MLKDKTLKYNWILSVVNEGERKRILSRILVRKCYWNVGIKHFSGETQKWQEGEKANELTFSDIYFNIMHYVIAQQFVLRWHYLNTLWRQFRVKFSHAIAWSAHSVPLRTRARALSATNVTQRHRYKGSTMANEFEFYCSIVAYLVSMRMPFAREQPSWQIHKKNYYTLNYRHFIFGRAKCERHFVRIARPLFCLLKQFWIDLLKWPVIKWISI